MVIVAVGTLWFGYLLVWWGRETLSGSSVGLADLAVPGHYKAGAKPAAPAGKAPPAVVAPVQTPRSPKAGL